MARGRRPEDWQRDLERARVGESELAALLAEDPRIANFKDSTKEFDRLDFSFQYKGELVEVDLKEKINPTSAGLGELWPEVSRDDLFVLDETVYRRIVWQGGGGYLVVHDHPKERWLVFGPWELTLGPTRRYVRWGERNARFAKGKILLDLTTASHSSPEFSPGGLLDAIDVARARVDQVEAIAIPGQDLPEIGVRDELQ